MSTLQQAANDLSANGLGFGWRSEDWARVRLMTREDMIHEAVRRVLFQNLTMFPLWQVVEFSGGPVEAASRLGFVHSAAIRAEFRRVEAEVTCPPYVFMSAHGLIDMQAGDRRTADVLNVVYRGGRWHPGGNGQGVIVGAPA